MTTYINIDGEQLPCHIEACREDPIRVHLPMGVEYAEPGYSQFNARMQLHDAFPDLVTEGRHEVSIDGRTARFIAIKKQGAWIWGLLL